MNYSQDIIDTGYKPHKYQADIHLNLLRFSVLVCHRRFGKTVLAINTLIDAAFRVKQTEPRYAYIAPYRNQAKSVAWDYLKRFSLVIPGVKTNESDLSVSFPNKARIRLFGADNADAMRGLYFDGAVMDEVADMKSYVWGEVIRPALSDRGGWCLFIGTPKGVNQFYELYHHAIADPNWYAGMYTVNDTDLPWLDDEELALAKSTMSENQYRQEFLCDFNASSENTLIPVDVITNAAGKLIELHSYCDLPRVIGVDVARFGDDRSCIQKRQGLAAFDPLIFKGVDNMHLAGLVAQEIEDWHPDVVFIDGGRGEGVIDRLRQLGYKNIIEVNFGGKATEFGRFANKRSEMWWKMAEWFEAGGVIPDNPELKADLAVPTYKFDSANRKLLEKKEDMKERVGFSPDLGDGLALTFAEPVHRQQDTPSKKRTYDPLTYMQGVN